MCSSVALLTIRSQAPLTSGRSGKSVWQNPSALVDRGPECLGQLSIERRISLVPVVEEIDRAISGRAPMHHHGPGREIGAGADFQYPLATPADMAARFETVDHADRVRDRSSYVGCCERAGVYVPARPVTDCVRRAHPKPQAEQSRFACDRTRRLAISAVVDESVAGGISFSGHGAHQ